MATLRINLPNQAVKEISEIDLETQTPNSLINELVEQEMLTRLPEREEYRLTKGSTVLTKDEHDKTMKEIGFKDGDEITVQSKPTGA